MDVYVVEVSCDALVCTDQRKRYFPDKCEAERYFESLIDPVKRMAVAESEIFEIVGPSAYWDAFYWIQLTKFVLKDLDKVDIIMRLLERDREYDDYEDITESDSGEMLRMEEFGRC